MIAYRPYSQIPEVANRGHIVDMTSVLLPLAALRSFISSVSREDKLDWCVDPHQNQIIALS